MGFFTPQYDFFCINLGERFPRYLFYISIQLTSMAHNGKASGFCHRVFYISVRQISDSSTGRRIGNLNYVAWLTQYFCTQFVDDYVFVVISMLHLEVTYAIFTKGHLNNHYYQQQQQQQREQQQQQASKQASKQATNNHISRFPCVFSPFPKGKSQPPRTSNAESVVLRLELWLGEVFSPDFKR